MAHVPAAEKRRQKAELEAKAAEAKLLEFIEDVEPAAEQKVRIAVERLLGSSEEGEVRYYRIVDNGKQADRLLGHMTLDEFLDNGEERVASEWGSGDYRFRVYNSKRELAANQRVSVELREEPVHRRVHTEPASIVAAPALDLSPLREAIVEQGKQMQAMLTTLLPLLVGRGGDTRKETLGMLEQFARILHPNGVAPAPALNPLDVITALERGIKLGQSSTQGEGGGEGESILPTILALAKQYLPAIGEQVQQMAAPGTPPALPPGHAPALVRVNGEGDMGLTDRLIGMRLAELVEHAKAGHYVEPYAAVIVDSVPRKVLDQYLLPADWFDRLVAAVPDAAAYAPWFQACRAEVLRLLTDSEAAGETGGTITLGAPVHVSAEVADPGSRSGPKH